MKKVLGLFIALSIFSAVVGAPIVAPPKKALKASEIMVPIGSGQRISLLDLSLIKVKDVETLTGKKMKFADKLGFRLAQRQLSRSINEDGTLNNRQLEKLSSKAEGSSFHLGGFALGFLLSIIGVLIAYLINDDLKAARTKWAWIGFAVGLVLWLLLSLL